MEDIITPQNTLILLNSKYKTQCVNNMNTNCIFSLTNPILRPFHFQLKITLINMNIPHSWYNINSYNNKLIYIVNGITYTITITSNNYNLTSLTSYLNTNMSGFTITYDSNTNKMTFYNATYSSFSISSASTCLTEIGLSTGKSTTNNYIISDYCCDVSYTKALYIGINVNLNSIDSRNELMYNNIIAEIPIEKNYLGIEVYKNYTGISHMLFENKITNLQLTITDEDDNIIDLNGSNWNCTILIEYIHNDAIDNLIPESLLMQT